MRMAAAEARRVLVEMAAAETLHAGRQAHGHRRRRERGARDKKMSYGELIGGKYFNVQLDWNKQCGNTLYAPGKAQPKEPKRAQDRRPADQREDIAPKVFAKKTSSPTSKCPAWCTAA